jgi:hypothetical protein
VTPSLQVYVQACHVTHMYARSSPIAPECLEHAPCNNKSLDQPLGLAQSRRHPSPNVARACANFTENLSNLLAVVQSPSQATHFHWQLTFAIFLLPPRHDNARTRTPALFGMGLLKQLLYII